MHYTWSFFIYIYIRWLAIYFASNLDRMKNRVARSPKCKSLNSTRVGKLRVAACLNLYVNNLPRINYFKATSSSSIIIILRTFSETLSLYFTNRFNVQTWDSSCDRHQTARLNAIKRKVAKSILTRVILMITHRAIIII